MKPKKSLGQHFLKNAKIVEGIVDAARLAPSDTVLEVGPGQGAMTFALARRAKNVIAVEYDRALAADLKKKIGEERIKNIEVVEEDIRTFRPEEHGLRARRYKIVANIPYYLTGYLLRRIVEAFPAPEQVILMLQKEVAERIVAKDGKESVLSLSVKTYGDSKILFTVGKENFFPVPKVDSAVIEISFLKRNDLRAKEFFPLLKAGFASKRQTIFNNLRRAYGPDRASAMLKSAGVAPSARAEELGIEIWLLLAKQLPVGKKMRAA